MLCGSEATLTFFNPALVEETYFDTAANETKRNKTKDQQHRQQSVARTPYILALVTAN
jgi:hypothetical protein